MDKNQLKQLVETIITLKEKLKCPICLDVIQDLIELECGHRYCAECYSKHKSTKKEVSCPLCNVVIKRRFTVYKDSYADALSKFIREISNDIHSHYNCQVEQLQKQLNEDQRPVLGVLRDAPIEGTSKNLPSTSKRQKNTRVKNADLLNAKGKTRDVFDTLMSADQDKLSINKTGTRQVYVNKKMTEKKPESGLYVNEFDNNESRASVLKWLSDTKNIFDRITQTQNSEDVEEQDTTSVVDLVSISQVRERCRGGRRKRAKSLEVEIKRVAPKERTRHSGGSRLEVVENYNIEEINTEEEKVVKQVEEKVLLDLIEDEYLDKLENEIHDMGLKTKTKVIKKGKTKGSAWEQVEKIAKPMKRREKEQLNVSLQSTQGSKCKSKKAENAILNSETINTIIKCHNVSNKDLKVVMPKINVLNYLTNKDRLENERRLKIVLQKTDTLNKDDINGREETLQNQIVIEGQKTPLEVKMATGIEPDKVGESGKSYDLNKLEDYITKNMKTIEKNTSLDDTVSSPRQKNSQQRTDIPVSAHEANKIGIADDTSPLEKVYVNEANNGVLLNTLEEILFEEPVEAPAHSKDGAPRDGDVIVVKDDSDLDRFYNVPTQEIHHTCKNPHREIAGKSPTSIGDAVNLLEDTLNMCLKNVNGPNLDVVENQLHMMIFHMKKLKSLTNALEAVKCDAGTQVVAHTVDVNVQTEVENNEAATQAVVKVESVATQTDKAECPNCQGADVGDSNEPQSIKNAMIPTVVRREGSVGATQRSVGANKSKPPSENEIFTETFDNLNFDTQEVTRNRGIIVRSTQKLSNRGAQNRTIQSDGVKRSHNISHNLSGMTASKKSNQVDEPKKSSQHLPGSVLVCSLASATASKEERKKLIYEPDRSRFKRIRMPTCDSDSDEETASKKVCNRFVRDDLTVEFQTNPAVANAESQDSENVNYDDYLAEVMKKYDNDNLPNTSSREKSLVEGQEKKVLKEIVTKCEAMIDQASKNLRHIRELADVSSSSKDSFQTASQSINNNFHDPMTDDNVFMDENNLQKLDKDIRDHEKENTKAENTKAENTKAENSESPDVIVDTEEMEPLPKRSRRADFNKPESASLFGQSQRRKEEADKKICSELNDSFDDAELANIDVCHGQEIKQDSSLDTRMKINIIDNVVIRNPVKEVKNVADEDLFSDDDIVETTPQEHVNSFAERSILSQINNLPIKSNINELLNSLTDKDNFDFDFSALPPPPDFQDDLQPTTPPNNDVDNDPTLLDDHANLNKSSLTPDRLSQFVVKGNDKSQTLSQGSDKENRVERDLSLTPDVLEVGRNLRKISHSTPVTQRPFDRETLGLSPISVRDSQRSNVIEVTQASKRPNRAQSSNVLDLMQTNYSPLSFVSKPGTHKQNILTSTPRQKSIWNYVQSQFKDEEGAGVGRGGKPCVACTRLRREQVAAIGRLMEEDLATFNPKFDRDVTHMVVSVDKRNCLIDYTTKFVSAVAAGLWVVRFEWVEECLKRKRIVAEEPYEALDISGTPGPRISRLTRKKNPLFKGYKFFCAEPFVSATEDEIKDIIEMLGGRILENPEGLLDDDGNIGLIIIGDGHASEDFERYERWVERYKSVTVDLEWLSKCVGQYKVGSIRQYIWCSDDNLTELDYPPHLMEPPATPLTETF